MPASNPVLCGSIAQQPGRFLDDGQIHSEEKHPISPVLIRLYEPVCTLALRWKWAVILGSLVLVAVTIPIYKRTDFNGAPIRIKAIQITLRIWDSKTKQSRQVSMVVDM